MKGLSEAQLAQHAGTQEIVLSFWSDETSECTELETTGERNGFCFRKWRSLAQTSHVSWAHGNFSELNGIIDLRNCCTILVEIKSKFQNTHILMNMNHTLSFCSCFWCANLKMCLDYQASLLSMQLGYKRNLISQTQKETVLSKKAQLEFEKWHMNHKIVLNFCPHSFLSWNCWNPGW